MGDAMLRQKILPAILVVLPATAALMAQTTIVEATADACRTRPGSATPPGSRWYYRVNRIDNHRCWYLSSQRVEVRSRERGALFVRRRLAHRSTSVVPKRLAQQDRQLDPRTATAQITSRRSRIGPGACNAPRFCCALARPDQLRRLWTRAKLRRRVIPIPIQRKCANALDAYRGHQARWTAADASAGEAAFGQVFLGGALVTALLVAGGVFHLARRPRRTHPHDQWCAAADRLDQRRHKLARSAEPVGNRLAAGTRHDAFIRPAPTATDQADDLKTSLRELTRDLQRAGLARVSPQSFAPRTRTGRSGGVLKQVRA